MSRTAKKEEYALSKKTANKIKKKNSDKIGTFEPGENSEIILKHLRLATLPKVDPNDAEAVKSRITEYFGICIDQDEKPSWAGLALSFGVVRDTLTSWKTGKTKRPPEVREALTQAYSILNALHEDNMQEGRINNVTGIFLAKANFGYQDNPQKQDVDVDTALGEKLSAEQLMAEYQDVDI